MFEQSRTEKIFISAEFTIQSKYKLQRLSFQRLFKDH